MSTLVPDHQSWGERAKNAKGERIKSQLQNGRMAKGQTMTQFQMQLLNGMELKWSGYNEPHKLTAVIYGA